MWSWQGWQGSSMALSPHNDWTNIVHQWKAVSQNNFQVLTWDWLFVAFAMCAWIFKVHMSIAANGKSITVMQWTCSLLSHYLGSFLAYFPNFIQFLFTLSNYMSIACLTPFNSLAHCQELYIDICNSLAVCHWPSFCSPWSDLIIFLRSSHSSFLHHQGVYFCAQPCPPAKLYQ